MPDATSHSRRIGRPWLLVVSLAVLAACSTPVVTPGASAPASPAAGATSDAEATCTAKGGVPTPRVATWNTNGDPSAWLELAGRQTFCEFESSDEGSPTRISVDLVTLTSDEPTLAAIAYHSPIRTTSPPNVSANPAGWSCVNDFGGTSAFGNTAAGGGWVDSSQPVFVVMNQCVFADGSSIDEFGLWYHANGVVRGADLAPLLAWQPGDEIPAVYERAVPAR